MKTWRKDDHSESNKLSVLIQTAILLWSVLGLMGEVQATSLCREEAAFIVSLQGIVELRRANEVQWQQVGMDTIICAGDSIRARTHSRAALRLRNDSMLRLDQKTSLTFPPAQTEPGKSLLDLFEGAIHIITRTPKPFKVRTPFVNASVDGTEFYVGLEQDTAKVVVYEGKVTASNDLGSVVLSDHEAAIATRDQAPRKEINIRPTDAVHWALYYPAIEDFVQDDTAAASNVVRQAGHLLTTGQADEAQQLLKQALTHQSNDSDIYALLAIIAVVQNKKVQALERVTQAITLNPQSTIALMAQSYVQQAHFDIEAALDSAQKALGYNAQHALVWARVAELQMSLGQLERAMEAAQQAVKLQPDLAKTQTVLGFAHLLQIDTRTAKEVFQRAIALDQADPMPRLGMGIALIREGELEQGRIELEIAASLDPANSLIRSYLGKAYFEEKRYPLASTQFDLAKERDPKDPTPWFYDAIQKQTQNRPVEALRDIQKSIELNDNRAVYRSRFLLDRDEAARGSSLARIFENLGFERRAVMETAKSLSFDPANHSAHRFLSDTYVNIPRHEAARVSELLQAQLLQPINVNPVQPHMAVADLNIITNTGPSSPGFNEFAPLMERSKPQLVASGVAGSNATLGNEIVFSRFNERTSISLGQFHYETKGFRTNNDQNHDIFNVFAQHALTSKLNIQAEVRTRSSDQGNLLQNFDEPSDNPRDAQNRIRRKIDEDSVRVGAKYDMAPNQNIIASGQFNNRRSEDIDPFISSTADTHSAFKAEAFQTEIQYQFRSHRFNALAGSGIYRTSFDQNTRVVNSITGEPCCFGTSDRHSENNRDNKTNGYIYTNLNFTPNLNATAGFSYDFYKMREIPIDGFNPKFGLQWNLNNFFRLRMAWIETIKAPLATNQTIEPTQVAGFNQLFDDINGTKSRRMGIGLDAHYKNKVLSGFEISNRDLSIPVLPDSTIPKLTGQNHDFDFINQKENLYYGYLYGILHKNWTVKSEIRFEKLLRSPRSDDLNRLDTFSMPIGIDYFSPQGIFANLTGTFVHQKVDRRGEINDGVEKFFLVDASVGYRLPKRMGILSLEARNIFDEAFLFQNINIQTSQSIVSRFVPMRTIFARVTLNF